MIEDAQKWLSAPFEAAQAYQQYRLRQVRIRSLFLDPLFFCVKDCSITHPEIASWHRLWLELGRYLIAFEPLTFVLD